jgi:FdhD protein
MNAKRPTARRPPFKRPRPPPARATVQQPRTHNRASTALAEEVALAIAYNGISQAVMLVTPTDLEDFIVGFSIGSGIIADAATFMTCNSAARVRRNTRK